MNTGITCRMVAAAFFLAAALIGCRKDNEGTSYEGDLGRDGTILLPTSSTWVSADIAKGQAEWHPFRKPGDAPPEADVTTGAPASTEGENGDAVEKALREFIEGYNDVVQTAPAEELLDYYVVEQQEALKPLLEAVASLASVDSDLSTELETKLADDPDRASAVVASLDASSPCKLSVRTFSDVSAAGATAELAPGSLFPSCAFVLVDQDWYLKVPEGEVLAQSQATLEATLTARKGWLEALGLEAADVDSIVKQIEEAAKVNQATDQPPDDDKTDDAPAAAPEEPGDGGDDDDNGGGD